MSDQEDLDYYIMFPSFPPSPKDPTLTAAGQDQREEFVFMYEEDKRPVVILLGWAGCQDRYLAKYSSIYEEKRYSEPLIPRETGTACDRADTRSIHPGRSETLALGTQRFRRSPSAHLDGMA